MFCLDFRLLCQGLVDIGVFIYMKDEIILLIKEYFKDNTYGQIGRKTRDFCKKFPQANAWLEAKLLDNPNYENIKNIIKCIVHDIKLPRCAGCGKELRFSQMYFGSVFCSVKCALNNDAVKQKASASRRRMTNDERIAAEERRKQTCLAKYGVEYSFQADEVKRKAAETMMKKYGVDNVMKSKTVQEKAKATTKKKFGVEYAFQSEEVKAKIKDTLYERYGVDSPIKAPEIKKKIEKTNVERYGAGNVFANGSSVRKMIDEHWRSLGVENPGQLEEVKEKIKKTNIERYGVECAVCSEVVKERKRQNEIERSGFEHHSIAASWKTIQSWKEYVVPMFSKKDYAGMNADIEYEWKCAKCGCVFKQRVYSTHHIEGSAYIPRCLNCYPHKIAYSGKENELVDFCKSFGFELKQHDRTLIKPLELDIVVPDLKIAIEFNGDYWHSIESIREERFNYHLEKVVKCNEAGYRLICVWENEWDEMKDEVKKRLADVFNGNERIDFTKPLDRSWYNNIDADGYELKEIQPPVLIERGPKNKYHVPNCGYLIYEKVK